MIKFGRNRVADFFIMLITKEIDHKIMLGGCVNATRRILRMNADNTLLDNLEVLRDVSTSFKNLGVCVVKKIV